MPDSSTAILYRWEDLPRESLNSHIERRLETGYIGTDRMWSLVDGGLYPGTL